MRRGARAGPPEAQAGVRFSEKVPRPELRPLPGAPPRAPAPPPARPPHTHKRCLMRRHQLCLRLVQALVGDGHDLVEDVADVLLPAVAVRPFVAVRGRRQGHAPLHRVAGQVHPGQSLQHPGLIVHPAARGRERAAAAEAKAEAAAAAAATREEKKEGEGEGEAAARSPPAGRECAAGSSRRVAPRRRLDGPPRAADVVPAARLLRPTRRELHASDSAWYTFPLFPSGGGTLRVPGSTSRANRIALCAERGGTETRKRCPNWSVRKVLGRGGDRAGEGPAPPTITIETAKAQFGVGASSRALRGPSRNNWNVLHRPLSFCPLSSMLLPCCLLAPESVGPNIELKSPEVVTDEFSDCSMSTPIGKEEQVTLGQSRGLF
ncbi:hypothetical protein J0S82_007683 [Galemys pyrenaicus]|uniref:Uncharacterized protein n=1 Tax=Galemys pyrenaicus TaxID=202257 RepID=A0A8J6DNM0_GALPY|nr:hypothetical protein J0S82_007683 [Galemys pyrenaicus]